MHSQQQYIEIVKRFADRKGDFMKQFRNTLKKYRPGLSDDRIDDLFQDAFLAARKNLLEGRVKENTSWNSYLIAIGLNLATHEYRKFGRYNSFDSTGSPGNGIICGIIHDGNYRNLSEEEEAEYNSPEVQKVFGETLQFMNDSCRKILEMSLYDRLSQEEIAAELGSTAKSIKVRKSRCKEKFIELVSASLRSLGYELKP